MPLKMPCSIKDKGYIKDWCTFKVKEAKFEAQFKGNVVDLNVFKFTFLP